TSIFSAHTGTPFTIFDCTNGVTNCVRLVQTAPISTRVSEQAPQDATTPDLFHLIDTSTQTPGVFVNPLTGISDVGPFPANTTGPNRFGGPGFGTSMPVFTRPSGSPRGPACNCDSKAIMSSITLTCSSSAARLTSAHSPSFPAKSSEAATFNWPRKSSSNL